VTTAQDALAGASHAARCRLMEIFMQLRTLCLTVFLFPACHLMAQPAPPVPAPAPAPGPQWGRGVPFEFFYEGPRVGGSYLGVGLGEIDEARAKNLGLPEPAGVEVTNVDSKSPADAAGIQRGDVILEFGGQKVVGGEHFIRLVRETPVGRKVAMKVFRGGSSLNLTAAIGRRDSPSVPHVSIFGHCEDGQENCIDIQIPKFNFRSLDFDIPRPNFVVKNRGLGVEMEEIDGQLAEHFGVKEGVLLRSVDADSPASKAGLLAGDVLVSIAGKPVQDVKDVRNALHSAQAGAIALEVMRNKSKRTLQLESSGQGSQQRAVPGRPVRVRSERL
jgi:serine protease Do